MDIKNRLSFLILTICLTVLGGSWGYFIIFGGAHPFMDCVYMTVISLTTVGYGEVLEVSGNSLAEIYTMALIVCGMGILAYSLSTLTAILIEGQLSGILRARRMEKKIAKLSDHYIVCGGGETGRPVIAEIVTNRAEAVLVEQDEENIERCRAIGDILYVRGDATDDEVLRRAGIEKAAGIIITLASGKDTLFVTMAARMLNHDIRIISRMVDPKLEPKLRKAGADAVVSPNFIGALRMASEMLRPTVVDFLDSMLRSTRGTLRVHEINITEGSRLIGKRISESGINDQFNLLVLGAKDRTHEIEFNPAADMKLETGLTLIVMGDVADIARAKKTL
jgi:voltage-gated potassium channel